MSVNIRNYVSDDHIESIGEIAKSQSSIIQALSLDNSKLEREIERLNENNQAYQEEVCRVWEERDNLYRRILEAVEYIEKWQSFQHTNGTTHEELRNLKDILKGEIK